MRWFPSEQAGPGIGTTTANLPLAKLYGRTIAMNMWDGIGTSNYHSLQALLAKRLSQGLMVRSSYTFGKSLSMADEDGWTSLAGGWNWDPVVKRNYAPSGYDRTHMFTAGWNYELPVGNGKKLAISNKVADFLVGGWKFSGTFMAYSGTAFTVSGSGSSLQATGNSQTADQIAPVVKLGGKGPNNPYYDPMSFRDPLFAFQATGNTVYRFGSTGRNILRGPGYWQLNPAIFKDFKIKEKVNAEFRAESTNFTNTSIWGNPNAGSASLRLNPDGSLNRSVADPLQNFMCITGATAGRTFRFGLRVRVQVVLWGAGHRARALFIAARVQRCCSRRSSIWVSPGYVRPANQQMASSVGHHWLHGDFAPAIRWAAPGGSSSGQL